MPAGERSVRRAGRLASAAASVSGFVLAALVPKCPLCVAAALAALGVGGAIAEQVAPFARVAGFVVAGVVALAVVSRGWRRSSASVLVRGCGCARGSCARVLPDAADGASGLGG